MHDRMKITVETVAQIKPDMQELIREHWEEIAHDKDQIPLDPDYEAYQRLEALGKVLICSARIDGKLVGYSIFFVTQHPHYKSTKVASNDILYLQKQYRGTGLGPELIRFSESAVLLQGAKKVTWHIKPEFDFSSILSRMDYHLDELVYARVVGD